MIVLISHRDLKNFIRRAWRKTPNEHLEALLGKVKKGVVHISAIYHIDAIVDRYSAAYVEDDALETLQDDLEDTKLTVVGTIHTHVGIRTCEHHSDADIQSHITDGEIVSAVVNLWVKDHIKHSAIYFYCPYEPVEIQYIR